MKLCPAWINADLPNFLNLSKVVEALRLLWETFKNLMLFRGGKSEGKLPFNVLFDKSKKESVVREEMGFTFPLMLQLERSRWCRLVVRFWNPEGKVPRLLCERSRLLRFEKPER